MKFLRHSHIFAYITRVHSLSLYFVVWNYNNLFVLLRNIWIISSLCLYEQHFFEHSYACLLGHICTQHLLTTYWECNRQVVGYACIRLSIALPAVSKVLIIYSPTSSAWEFQLLHIFVSSLFHISHFSGYVMFKEALFI